MAGYTEEQVEEMVREAVERTGKSFGGTFKRLKSENEELLARLDDIDGERERERGGMEERIRELEALAVERGERIADMAVTAELSRQMNERGLALPERFIDRGTIVHDEDPDILRENVAAALEKGREEFGRALASLGLTMPEQPEAGGANPANPPSRDALTARGLRRSDAREALEEMRGRGLLRR